MTWWGFFYFCVVLQLRCVTVVCVVLLVCCVTAVCVKLGCVTVVFYYVTVVLCVPQRCDSVWSYCVDKL